MGGGSRPSAGQVTIADVARHANVAPSTVSYALSGKRAISEEVRSRIAASIETLGFVPHAGARALASQRTNILALLVPLRSGLHVPVMMEFATAIVTEARSYDHDVLLMTHEPGPDDLQRVASAALADAVIVMDVHQQDERLPILRSYPKPVVLIGIPEDPAGLICVDLDWAAAGRLAVEHLAAKGHRRIGLLGQPDVVHQRRAGFAERCQDGFNTAARAHGLASATVASEPTLDSVRAGLRSLDTAVGGASALVVHNESIVPLLLEELRARDRLLPADLSVIVISPEDVAERASIPLTSVRIPVDTIGRAAVRLVMAQLSNESPAPLTMLAPEVIERGTTGKPAAAANAAHA